LNAPLLWIGLPLGVAGGLWLARKRRRLVVGLATAFCLMLVALAWLAPLGATLRVGPISLNFSSTLTLLGRRLVLDENDRSFLILLYLFGAVWFFGSSSARVKPYFIPVGLVMIALMVAAQAVTQALFWNWRC
jgi:LPXTG-motif cell wall-anchored protein